MSKYKSEMLRRKVIFKASLDNKMWKKAITIYNAGHIED